MSSDPWQGGELDEALSQLETTDQVSEAAKPPPLPIAEYKGRTEFSDLFDLEKEPAPGLRAGPDEKLEYFRHALKKAETAIQRFREAWAVREREMDSLEALAEREHGAAEKTQERLTALERFVGDKRDEFDAYSKRIAEVFTEKEAIEKELREAKKEAEKQLARERLERKEREAELARDRKEHEHTLRREREEHAGALREENQAQEKEMREAKRAHEERMRQERKQLEARLAEERALLETMLREEREQHEHALQTERKRYRDAAEAERKQHAEELQGHAEDKAAAELELAQAQLRIEELELHERDLRRRLEVAEEGGSREVSSLRTLLAAKEEELQRQLEVEAAVRAEAAQVETDLYDRIEVLQDNLRKARELADEASDAQRRAVARAAEHEGSIRELSSTLDLERRALRDAELMHREHTMEFPGPAPRPLNPEEQAKLQRAIAFVNKVIGSVHTGKVSGESLDEVLKRARVALGVARELVEKLER